MKKTIAFEVDDELFDIYLRPKLQQRKLSKLVSQFFELYANSKEVRQYFDNIDARGAQKRIKALENIINDTEFLRRMGMLDAELDDLTAQARTAKRQNTSYEETTEFTFEDDDISTNSTQYATKEDISRIENTMEQILNALNGASIQPTMSKSASVSQDSNEGYLTANVGEGEDAGNALDMLDQMFSFDD